MQDSRPRLDSIIYRLQGNRQMDSNYKRIKKSGYLAVSTLVQHPIDGENIVTAGEAVHQILELPHRLQYIYRCRCAAVRIT